MDDMNYTLRLMETEGSTGYFACVPTEAVSFESAVAYLRSHPYDQFMRDHALWQVSAWTAAKLATEIQRTREQDDFLTSLFLEACLRYAPFEGLRKNFVGLDINVLGALSPLIDIRSHLATDQVLHREWMRLFQANIHDHRELPSPRDVSLKSPISEACLEQDERAITPLPTIHSQWAESASESKTARVAPEETSRKALERLEAFGIIADKEYRHQASLSPIALLRKWHMNISVQNERHHYRLSGLQTSYGRGLDVEIARAAYAMEMVERVSSFASVGPRRVEGYKAEHRLVKARHSELAAQNMEAVDPNALAIDVTYGDEPLFWLMGEGISVTGNRPVWVPAQCVFLFSNLDEVGLFSGLGSTGLASGNTMAEAKVSALLEVIERDSEAVMPFHPSLCFDLEAQDPGMEGLLEQYYQSGIRIQFQDITTEFGIPCCKCFVRSSEGVAKGTGAHLNAKRALLSALTETPYPFPGPPSGPALPDVVRVPLENLPDYSTGNPETDLALLENVFLSNGHSPIYVDLTHGILDLPVVRAIVPGLQVSADFDSFSRVSPRLFDNYRRLFSN